MHTFYLLLFNLYVNKFDFDTGGAIICLVAKPPCWIAEEAQ